MTRSGSIGRRNDEIARTNERGVWTRRAGADAGRSTSVERASSASAIAVRGRMRMDDIWTDGPLAVWFAMHL